MMNWVLKVMSCLGKIGCEDGGGGVLLYVKYTIPAYEIQLQEEADCKEAI